MNATVSGVSVSGGAGSIRVDAVGLRAAAPMYAGLGGEVDGIAASCGRDYWSLWAAPATDPAAGLLIEAQALLGSAQAALNDAAGGLRRLGTELARAADEYSGTEQSVVSSIGHWFAARWHDDLEPAAAGLAALPEAAALAWAVGRGTRSASRGLEAFATEDPRLLDTVGLSAELGEDQPWVAGLFAVAPRLYPDGHSLVAAAGLDTAAGAVLPPRSLAGLVGGLGWRDAHEEQTTTTKGGEIDVKFLHHADGTRSVVVDIPGTKVWNDPGRDADVADFGSNVRAVQGLPTTYAKGVLAAMARAGVRPDDDVLLAGHSLGGMVAVEVAATAARTKRFHVTHVLTAGSPIGRTVGRLPSSIQVLALENSDDVVPEADARANPVRPNVTTVRSPVQHLSVGDNHSLTDSYAGVASGAEADGGASVRYFEAGASRFLDADSVTTERFVITRGYG